MDACDGSELVCGPKVLLSLADGVCLSLCQVRQFLFSSVTVLIVKEALMVVQGANICRV